MVQRLSNCSGLDFYCSIVWVVCGRDALECSAAKDERQSACYYWFKTKSNLNYNVMHRPNLLQIRGAVQCKLWNYFYTIFIYLYNPSRWASWVASCYRTVMGCMWHSGSLQGNHWIIIYYIDRQQILRDGFRLGLLPICPLSIVEAFYKAFNAILKWFFSLIHPNVMVWSTEGDRL